MGKVSHRKLQREQKKAKKKAKADLQVRPIAFNNLTSDAGPSGSPQQASVSKDMERFRKLSTTKDSSAIGKLGNFLPTWEYFTEDREIIQTIKGKGIQLTEMPFQDRIPKTHRSTDLELLKKEVEKLRQRGVVEYAEHEEGEYISNVFVVRKKDTEEFRLILNLSRLNEDFVEYKKFKMETLKSIIPLITPNCWFYSIDFSDAYYSIPVHKELRKYLRFELDGILYQYTCMPNGYKDAPRLFTKLLKVPLGRIREELGATLAAYLDDSLGIETGRLEELSSLPYDIIKIFQQFGYTINWEKSVLDLTKKIEFLGFVLDSETMLISLSAKKAKSVKRAIKVLLKQENPTIREVCQVIGKLIATMPANRLARRFTTNAISIKDRALKDSFDDYDATMKLTEEVRQDLLNQIELIMDVSCPIFEPKPDLELFSDASTEGWGVHAPFRNDALSRFGGRWDCFDADKHINTLETKAVWIGETYALQDYMNVHVRLRVDNTTAVAAIKKQGDLKNEERNQWSRAIWDFARARNIWLTIQHIPGVENVIADEESRYFRDSAEWGITQQVREYIFNRWRWPDIDLFATSSNCVTSTFASWGPDPRATIIDSMLVDWSTLGVVYAFPPFPLIPRVLQKIVMDKAKGILIIPNWTRQTWYKHVLRIQLDYWDFVCRDDSVYLSVDNEQQRQHCPFGHVLRALQFDGKRFWS